MEIVEPSLSLKMDLSDEDGPISIDHDWDQSSSQSTEIWIDGALDWISTDPVFIYFFFFNFYPHSFKSIWIWILDLIHEIAREARPPLFKAKGGRSLPTVNRGRQYHLRRTSALHDEGRSPSNGLGGDPISSFFYFCFFKILFKKLDRTINIYIYIYI